MRTLPIVIVSASVILSSCATTEKTKGLEARIQKLEERMAVVEKEIAQAQQNLITPEQKKMIEIAEQHVAEERTHFKMEDIEKAEELYQKAARNLASYEAKKLLDRVVSEYPKLNRAGCAQLYRAQQEDGLEKERLLQDCIQRFNNTYYLDGTQVGAYATFQLAQLYKRSGKSDEADKLFARIRKDYPTAVDHRGLLLVSEIY